MFAQKKKHASPVMMKEAAAEQPDMLLGKGGSSVLRPQQPKESFSFQDMYYCIYQMENRLLRIKCTSVLCTCYSLLYPTSLHIVYVFACCTELHISQLLCLLLLLLSFSLASSATSKEKPMLAGKLTTTMKTTIMSIDETNQKAYSYMQIRTIRGTTGDQPPPHSILHTVTDKSCIMGEG